MDIIERLLKYDIVCNLLDYVYNSILEKQGYFCVKNCVDSIQVDDARKILKHEGIIKKENEGLLNGANIDKNLESLSGIKEINDNYRGILYFLFQSKYEEYGDKIPRENWCEILYLFLQKQIIGFDQDYAKNDSLIYNQKFEFRKISSLSSFVKSIEEDDNNISFFRGHSDINYLQIPGLHRDSYLVNEEAMIQEIKITHSLELQACKNKIQERSLLQHYGFATELLDITGNPLVALYFACENKKGIGEVIHYSVAKNDVHFEEDVELMEQEENICETDYLFVQPVYGSNQRLANQRGAFILFYKEDICIKERKLRILYIESKAKKAILNDLKRFGIDESFIYPELEYKCKAVRKKYKIESKNNT